MRETDWSKVLDWPGDGVRGYEIEEQEKTLKLWVRPKSGNRKLVCSGCGRKLAEACYCRCGNHFEQTSGNGFAYSPDCRGFAASLAAIQENARTTYHFRSRDSGHDCEARLVLTCLGGEMKENVFCVRSLRRVALLFTALLSTIASCQT